MSGLEFTSVKVKLNTDKLCKAKAFVAITFNNLFKISGLQLIDGGKEYYIQYPTYTRLVGEVKPACYPTGEKFQQLVLEKVMEKFWEAKELTSEVS